MNFMADVSGCHCDQAEVLEKKRENLYALPAGWAGVQRFTLGSFGKSAQR